MYLSKSHRPTWVEINIDNLRLNYQFLRSLLPEDVSVMGVVKADAYGHGSVQVSQELLRLGAEYLAVSNIDEAIELRSAGISSPILLLGPVEVSEFGKLLEFNIYPSISSLDYAKELAESYRYRGVYPKVHIKVDTGMGRLGIDIDAALIQIEQISQLEGLIIDGIYSHFPSSDHDLEFSNQQIKIFNQLAAEIHKLNIKVRHFHIANSAAVLNLNLSLQKPYTMIRPGLALYGYSTQKNRVLNGCMSLKTRLMEIRLMKKGATVSYLRQYEIKKEKEYIGILPIGYADGIPTTYSGKGKVLIGDKFYPVVGRVCMDYIMVSLDQNEAQIKIGDEVTLFGQHSLTVEEFGKLCGRIPYEVTCGISKRVPRVYTRKEDERKIT